MSRQLRMKLDHSFPKSASHKRFSSESGTFDLPAAMAELTIYTASRSLQGREVRDKFDSTFAELYHDLDMGFTPINFMLLWAPLPQNRRRDRAQKKMTNTYNAIIQQKRLQGSEPESDQGSMIRSLMSCQCKDRTALTDQDIAHIVIALLMAGQHTSSSTISWILPRLASRPDIQEELFEEQKNVLGTDSDGSTKELHFEDLTRLKLHAQVVKETLRIHAPIHSILRKVKSPMPVPGTPYTIPATHSLLATPGTSGRMQEHFPEPLLWEPRRWDESPSGHYTNLAPSQSKLDGKEETIDYGYGLASKGAASPYLPFGAGRHRCIGEQFAYVQLQTILVSAVRDFKFSNLNDGDEVVGTDYSSLFSRPLSPAIVRWERRSS